MLQAASTLERLLILGGADAATFRDTLWLLVGAIMGIALALAVPYTMSIASRLGVIRSTSRQMPRDDRRL
jgi:hypothetical protein